MTNRSERTPLPKLVEGGPAWLRLEEERRRAMPDQWQAVADARERHEQRALDELAAETWRDRQRRVNDELWLDGAQGPEAPEFGQQTPDTYPDAVAIWVIGIAVVVLLGTLYVLSCGAGMCAL
jgi:hypothetical protein